jgi:DEAD/DEAH box helicase domain-containing protein
MNLPQLLDYLGNKKDFLQNITTWKTIPAQEAQTVGHIVVTNPDMLHQGILPHHTLWIKLFENLKFIVIDEIHAYRGVFGSHIANVIRRLKRICNFYGSDPQIMETCTPILFSGNDRRADIFL